MKHKVLTEAEKIILDHLARRRLKALAKRRGLSESLLRKIAKGKRKMTWKTAEILIHGYFDHAQFERDQAIDMTIHWDPDGRPTLIKAENRSAFDL